MSGSETKSPVRVQRAALALRGVREALAEAGAAFEPFEWPPPTDGGAGLVLAHYEALEEAARVGLRTLPVGSRLLLLSSGECRADFVELFASGALTNLVGVDGESVDAAELTVTLKKLLGGPLFGLEPYLEEGAPPPEVIRLAFSSEREPVLERVDQYARAAGAPSHVVARLCGVADELITNAIYDAPTDGAGGKPFHSLDRRVKVGLPRGASVEVKLQRGHSRLGISVSDPFGSLEEKRILSTLARCFKKDADQIEQKQGGAGLGLYYVLESVSQLVINIERGVRTEMIGFVMLGYPYRRAAARGKSFNIFVA